MSKIPGFELVKNYLTAEQERELIGHVKQALEADHPRSGSGRSRIVRYGWGYLEPGEWMGEIPAWLPDFEILFDNITLNEMPKGRGIAPHFDSKAYAPIWVLNLAQDGVMRMTRGKEARLIGVPRRSLTKMDGEARLEWKHEILPVRTGTRYSIVFRKKL